MIIKLRPHHLLCTQGYDGNGYNDEFVESMTGIVNSLRGDEGASVDIVYGADDICAKCPNLINNNTCRYNEKVDRYDKKVIKYFNITEKRYIYNEIIKEINSLISENILNDICCDCSWYSYGLCKSKILK